MYNRKAFVPYGKGVLTTLVAALLMASLCSATSLYAQRPVLDVDERIRVFAPGVLDGRLTGSVMSPRGDSIAVRGSSGEIRVIALSSITRIERSRGLSRGAGALKGALLGAGGGAGLGLVNAGFSDNTCEPGVGDCVSTATGVLIWTVLGLTVGTVVGAVRGSERWERVPFSLTTTRNGSPTLAVSRRW